MSKFMDVKSEPTTMLEVQNRWQNYTTTKLTSLLGKRIPVQETPEVVTKLPDIVISKSGCIMSTTRVFHTNNCSCDDEYEESIANGS